MLLLIGNQTGSVAATRAGGWFVFAFVAFVIYFYVAALWEETGGRALPLGRPLVSYHCEQPRFGDSCVCSR